MALIKTGRLSDFSTYQTQIGSDSSLKSKGLGFGFMQENLHAEPELIETIPSSEARGLAIKSIELTKGSEGILGNLFNSTNEIYFIAWIWDLSGNPVIQYPGDGFLAENTLFKIKTGKTRKFIGEGINLFPKREVKGGIAVRIQLWESDQKSRNFGKILNETSDNIKKSKLNNLLAAISMATGVVGTTIALVEKASLELANIIGTILKANSDNSVDFFEGYYAADQNWKAGEDLYEGNASKIVLNKY